jgi:hypothetical protein
MNTLMLVVVAVVALCYCGGKYCPSLLKQNKEMALGVLVGMALCSFTGLRLEGLEQEHIPKQDEAAGFVDLSGRVRGGK